MLAQLPWRGAVTAAAVLLPALDEVIGTLRSMAHAHAALPMLSRTHGQPATPTTLGKELANVATTFSASVPQIRLELDREKAKLLGINSCNKRKATAWRPGTS